MTTERNDYLKTKFSNNSLVNRIYAITETFELLKIMKI